jgi:hypothetical protein
MTDGFPGNYRFLARYNGWINGKLYEACDALTDEARKQDRGAFFGSLHHTLNHLVVADQVWLKRFAKCGADNGMPFHRPWGLRFWTCPRRTRWTWCCLRTGKS